MRYKRTRKTRVANMYFLIVRYNFKYVSDAQLPITSHNLLKKGYFLLFEKKDTLKCFCFLIEEGLSAVPLKLFGAVVRLQLRETIVVVIY